MNDPAEYDKQNFPGAENMAIRYYFYLKAGLGIVNDFRNLILGILGVYIALHLESWWLLIAMFVPSIVILTIAGYYTVHRVNKISEWLSLRFSTHYGIKQYNYTQGIYETLQEIAATLKK